ncbi:MAG: carboxypeptidase regulatory-like domain-containing protein [Acidobacteriia bacterium]|nr:carboxypeptidase regulatory-like domain-containing protein [Terriglobia bacterium]
MYTVPLLQPGTYDVTATVPGFKEYVRKGVVLQVGDVAGIDIRLGRLGIVSSDWNEYDRTE